MRVSKIDPGFRDAYRRLYGEDFMLHEEIWPMPKAVFDDFDETPAWYSNAELGFADDDEDDDYEFDDDYYEEDDYYEGGVSEDADADDDEDDDDDDPLEANLVTLEDWLAAAVN